MYLFIYQNELYARSDSLYKYDNNFSSFVEIPDFGNPLGYDSIVSKDNMLISTGNITGIAIYDANNNKQTIQLTPINTAEALILDNIHSLYSDSNNLMFIGPETSGFNTFLNGVFNSYELKDEIIAVGFFEHDGIHYVQGAGHLFSFVNNSLHKVCEFRTNGEEIFYDPAGYLWTYPNWGCNYGGIAMLNLSTDEIKGTYDSEGKNYWNVSETNKWQLDGQYHFNDIINIPGKDEVLIGSLISALLSFGQETFAAPQRIDFNGYALTFFSGKIDNRLYWIAAVSDSLDHRRATIKMLKDLTISLQGILEDISIEEGIIFETDYSKNKLDQIIVSTITRHLRFLPTIRSIFAKSLIFALTLTTFIGVFYYAILSSPATSSLLASTLGMDMIYAGAFIIASATILLGLISGYLSSNTLSGFLSGYVSNIVAYLVVNGIQNLFSIIVLSLSFCLISGIIGALVGYYVDTVKLKYA